MSENVTFRVVDEAGGAAHVLRLHRPGYHGREALDSERLWTQALIEAGIAAPRAIAARDGRYHAPVVVPATGERRFAGVAVWTRGEVLAEVIEREPDGARLPGWFEQLGALLAELHAQSSRWRPPPGFTRHHLDSDGLLGEAPFWGRFWEHPALTAAERTLMLRTRQRLRVALDRHGAGEDRYGVIHADLHPGNVLLDGQRLAVIDFDDTAFGWHVYDIAVALIHQQDKPYFSAVRDALLAGYRTVRALPEDMVALLPMFMLIRGLAQIGWLYQRPELTGEAHRTYLQRIRLLVAAQCEAFSEPG